MNELKLSGRKCVFCKNPARWRGEATKESDHVTCGNCLCHSSIGTIMELEQSLKLLRITNARVNKKKNDLGSWYNNGCHNLLRSLLKESKE